MLLDDTILTDFAKQIVSDLQDSITQSGISASGNLRDSIRFEITDTRLTVFGASYAFAAELGRGPSQQSGGDLRSAIRRWIDDKGIQPQDISKDSLAYIITKRIHEKGTLLFSGTDFYGRQKPTEILNGVVNDGRVEQLQNTLIAMVVKSIRKELGNANT